MPSYEIQSFSRATNLKTPRFFLGLLLVLSLKAHSQDISAKENLSAVTPTATSSKPAQDKPAKEKGLSPQYKSCKGQNLSQLEDPSANTEADFCIGCAFYKVKNFIGWTDIQEKLKPKDKKQTEEFRKKLQKRVIGQVSARIFQMKKLKACVDFDGNSFPGWDTLKTEDKTSLKQQCDQQTSQLKSAVNSRWSDMKVHLALSSPRVREDNIVPTRIAWFDNSPSHLVSDFASSLPHLTNKERKTAEEKYINAMAGTKGIKTKPEDLKHRLSNKLRLNLKIGDLSRLKHTERQFRKQQRQKYLQKVQELPILAYLNKNPPSGKDLANAIDQMEGQLQTMLEKVEAKDVDLGLLLSFNPLVEGLLSENKQYCLVAEAGRIEAEGDEKLENFALLGASLLSAIPCLSGGIVGKVFCLGAESLVGVKGYELAQEGMEESLGRMLTGKDYEKIANLEGKQRELFLEKLFLPLAVWGGAVPLLRSAKRGGVAKQGTSTATDTATNTKNAVIPSQTNKLQQQYIDSLPKNTQRYINNLPSREKADYIAARQIEEWGQEIPKPFKDKGFRFVERTFKNPNQGDHMFRNSPRTIVDATAPSAENLRLRRTYNPRISAYYDAKDKKFYVTRKWDRHSTFKEDMPPEFSKIDVDMEKVLNSIPQNLRDKFSPRVKVYINESGQIVVEKKFRRTYNKDANGNRTLSKFWLDENSGFKPVQKDVGTQEFARGEELRTALPGSKLTTEDIVTRAIEEERKMPLDIALNSGRSMSVTINDIPKIPAEKIPEIKSERRSQSLNFIFRELSPQQTVAVTPLQMKHVDLSLITPQQARVLSKEQVRSMQFPSFHNADNNTVTAVMSKLSQKQISDIPRFTLEEIPNWPKRLDSEQVNGLTLTQLEKQSDEILQELYSEHYFNMGADTLKKVRAVRPDSFWKGIKVRAQRQQ